MNPIQIAKSLQTALVGYLTTIFDVNRDGQEPELAQAIKMSISAPGALFSGPYLEIAPPYVTGASLSDLCDQGILSDKIRSLRCFQQGLPIGLDVPLYLHQATAIRRLAHDRRSIVVSSGTGSGKTECFLIPLMNDLLIDPDPGVRAILIYPLNALVNDQLDRLRKLLAGTPLTFGRYTSELAETTSDARARMSDAQWDEYERNGNEIISREQIRNNERLPQILITNYAMLEYLLLRPEDSILFSQGRWRFVVLDEAHSYQGAQGIEVAMLLRRLKHRLGKRRGDMQFVATSATLTDDDAGKAAEFATSLFGESFAADDVIFGKVDEQFIREAPQSYRIDPAALLHEDVPALLEELRHSSDDRDTERLALQLAEMQIIPDSTLKHADQPIERFLFEALHGNHYLTQLRQWMLERRDEPAHVSEAAQNLFDDSLHDDDNQLQALYHLIELGAMAREKPDQPSLLPARYHLFARAPQGVWVCINPACPGRTTSPEAKWSRMFANRHETCDACGCHIYPVVVCRDCGQVYLRTLVERETRRLIPPPDDSNNNASFRYLLWKSLSVNPALGEGDDEDEENPLPRTKSVEAEYTTEAAVLCVRCGRTGAYCQCGTQSAPVQVWQVKQITTSNKGELPQFVERIEQCPRCRGKAQAGTEIVTTISVGGVTPLALLTYELYRQLPESTNEAAREKPGAGRKLLTFYDSRQGAARFAAFLQDVVNLQNYRHIIAESIRQHHANRRQHPDEDYLPSVETIATLSVRLAQETGIFHNDPDSQIWRSGLRKLTGEQRTKLRTNMATRILAEFTTNRDERQSLERLGVIGVTYFEPDNEPDFGSLALEIGLTVPATRTLVCYLLDSLRKAKCITLPEKVEAHDALFGRNMSNPSVVRHKSGSGEAVWIGSTPRQQRRRLVQSVLHHFNLPDDNDAVIRTMIAIWEWLIRDEVGVMERKNAGSYQIRHECIFYVSDADWHRCNRCLRLSTHGGALPCPTPDCGGTLEAFEPATQNLGNYFFSTYQRGVLPLRVEEHTAQLASEKGRQYQDMFRDGTINALSCSTTFEMGIDLGDLQAVVMNNVPPTVANYRQRAGRAGRRASGTAFILTWASERPHDQNYFRNPPEIIRGHVRIPFINMENQYIRQRHINAILLSMFLRYRADAGYSDLKGVGVFFDPQTNGGSPHYAALNHWLELRDELINATLGSFSELTKLAYSPDWRRSFISDMEAVNAYYLLVAQYYQQQFEIAHKLSANAGNTSGARAEMDRYEKLLERLNRDTLIDYLSGRGVLPSYSFPLHSVELLLPFKYNDEKLRLERDLKQAIREYAPGSEVVADKRIWHSSGLQFYRDTPRLTQYRICGNCGHLELSLHEGFQLSVGGECVVCGQERRSALNYLTPDGFRADNAKSGDKARQYVARQPALMRSALIPVTDFDELGIGSIAYGAYKRDGELLYVNEGSGQAFRICMKCGSQLSRKQKKCPGRYRGAPCPGDVIETVALGHRLMTDTLHLRFESRPDLPIPELTDTSFWMSLMTALIHGASRALQIERRDLGGVLSPRFLPDQSTWVQTIVLFDDVSGGAGHVQQIQREFRAVVHEALRIVNCTDCAEDTSCYRCLRDYSNQEYHSILRRDRVMRFLMRLRDDLDATENGAAAKNPVIAANLPHWLYRKLGSVRQRLILAADFITLQAPLAASGNWIDVLYDLARRNVEVDLLLVHLPDVTQRDGLSSATHLKSLMERKLRLWQIDALPDWQVVIDPARNDSRMAIQMIHESLMFSLDQRTGEAGLQAVIDTIPVENAQHLLLNMMRQPVAPELLNPPASVRVFHVPEFPGQSLQESDLFANVFAKPVKKLEVNDAYLFDYERIVNRLGAYIAMAYQGGALESVVITTRKAGAGTNSGNWEDQRKAESVLQHKYGEMVRFKHPQQQQHDRYIQLDRADGERARIWIGLGLDFIQSNAPVKSTYIVIEDPI